MQAAPTPAPAADRVERRVRSSRLPVRQPRRGPNVGPDQRHTGRSGPRPAPLAFAPRTPNGKKCTLHERRVQLASGEVLARLEIGIETVGTAAVVEGITAPGEVGYDPTRLARLSARLPGVVRHVERQLGDRVKAGDILAVVDAAEVGRAKAEFQQALAAVESRTRTLAQKKGLEGGAIASREVREAEAALEEAQVRRLVSEQALANLGLPVRADEVKGLSPAELAARLRFLGIPDPLRYELSKETASANLLPVRASLDGEVVARAATPGQAADPAKPLFMIADTSRVWLTLRVRFEDADRVTARAPVRFRHGDQSADGIVAWVSPAADERTRGPGSRRVVERRRATSRRHGRDRVRHAPRREGRGGGAARRGPLGGVLQRGLRSGPGVRPCGRVCGVPRPQGAAGRD